MIDFFKNRDFQFYIVLLTALIIIRTPFVGKYFRVVNTLIHENAHAIAALLLNGGVKRIELYSDLSGTATTINKSRFANVIVSLVGYPASSFSAFLMLFMVEKHYYLELLLGLLFLSLISLLFFVRNKYGVFWLICFIILCSFVYYLDIEIIASLFLLFLSFIVLSESCISAFELLLITLKKASSAGDAANLKKATYIPAFVWSLIFVCIAFYVLFLSVSTYFPYFNKL